MISEEDLELEMLVACARLIIKHRGKDPDTIAAYLGAFFIRNCPHCSQLEHLRRAVKILEEQDKTIN